MADGKMSDIIEEGRQEVFERLRQSFDEPARHEAEPVEENAKEAVDNDDVGEPAPTFEPEPTVGYCSSQRIFPFPIPLEFPIILDGVLHKTVLLNMPPVGSVRKVVQGQMTTDELYAEMASVPVSLLRALRWPDAERVTTLARLFAPELEVA